MIQTLPTTPFECSISPMRSLIFPSEIMRFAKTLLNSFEGGCRSLECSQFSVHGQQGLELFVEIVLATIEGLQHDFVPGLPARFYRTHGALGIPTRDSSGVRIPREFKGFQQGPLQISKREQR